jgi:hypothetical protein
MYWSGCYIYQAQEILAFDDPEEEEGNDQKVEACLQEMARVFCPTYSKEKEKKKN